MNRTQASVIAAACAALGAMPVAAEVIVDPAWVRPTEPFQIADGVYYVGTEGLASYLVVTPRGDVLLDGGYVDDAPLIERNIEKLGFRVRDVRVILNSHAHSDHAGGIAKLKRDSGARLYASAGDRWALEHGRHRGDDNYGGARFPAVKVDRVVRDGQVVRVGDEPFTAVLTPGHTAGCTTWVFPVRDGARNLTAAFAGCFTVAGNTLVGNRAYPGIAADYRSSFRKLRALKVDIVLPTHPEFTDLAAREKRSRAGDKDAFVDPKQLTAILDWAEPAFERELAKQQGAHGSAH